jgi:serine/threonine protein kinase
MLERFGKYEILRRIGTGGFGAVYEARDPMLKRRVAVKTCEIPDPEIQTRFFREAELAGSLHHRNITTIHDSGIHDGMPYLVQEFLDGEDLDRIIRRGAPLSVARKLEILIGVAYGLEHAHAEGIVHRDIKPSNVRLLGDGTVKIMDFGIAKSLRGDMDLTDAGVTVGTSAYLSPEQIRGQSADQRTDIFAFGVLAYELLTGRKPFAGDTLPKLFDDILQGKPQPITDCRPEVPAELSAIVHRAMQTSPEERFASASELREELLAVQNRVGKETSVHVVPIESSSLADPDRADTSPLFALGTASPSLEADSEWSPPGSHSTGTTIRARRGSRQMLPAAVAAMVVFLALLGAVILLWPSGTRPPESPARSDSAGREAARSAPPPAPASVAQSPSEPSAPPLPVPEGPAPERVADATKAGTASEDSGSRIAVRAGRRVRPVEEESPLPADRYTRAAMEPGLSDETRAHILLQSALSRHQAGDDRGARASLRAAFALSPNLPTPPALYGPRFAKLAEAARASRVVPETIR